MHECKKGSNIGKLVDEVMEGTRHGSVVKKMKQLSGGRVMQLDTVLDQSGQPLLKT